MGLTEKGHFLSARLKVRTGRWTTRNWRLAGVYHTVAVFSVVLIAAKACVFHFLSVFTCFIFGFIVYLRHGAYQADKKGKKGAALVEQQPVRHALHARLSGAACAARRRLRPRCAH